MTGEERTIRTLDGTLPAHIPPLKTTKIDAVSRTRIRRAFAELAQGNIEEVQDWLHLVANGRPEGFDEAGFPVVGINPQPARAIELFIELAKFSTPQVKAVALEVSDGKSVRRMSMSELMAVAVDAE